MPKNDGQRYSEWMRTRRSEERDLQVKAFEYEDRYFADFTLRSSAMQNRLATLEVRGEDGEWSERLEELPTPTLANWLFRYRRFRDGTYGLCDFPKKSIFVRRGLEAKDEKGTLLHELIHAYEMQLPPVLREWLLIDLWESLKRRIGKSTLERFIDRSNHIFSYIGSHGVLFLLKSIDIDRRNKWEYGTTFGYGRERILHG